MTDMQTMSRGISDFLYEYRFENWMRCNPKHEALHAKTRRGLLALIRVAVPACGKERDARVAEALRQSGFEVLEDDAGFYVERDMTPAVATG